MGEIQKEEIKNCIIEKIIVEISAIKEKCDRIMELLEQEGSGDDK